MGPPPMRGSPANFGAPGAPPAQRGYGATGQGSDEWKRFLQYWAERVAPEVWSSCGFSWDADGRAYVTYRVACADISWSTRLLARGVAASSCDSPDQDIGCTLDDSSETFWSSSGSEVPPVDQSRGLEAATSRQEFETLTYRLQGPCELRAVAVTFFRADFQMGAPVYPCEWAEVLVGASPSTLQPVGPRMPIRPSSELQVLPVWPPVLCAGLLQVRLFGKPQRQLEDGLRYVAVLNVRAVGRLLGPDEVLRAERVLRMTPRPFGTGNWEALGGALDARLLGRAFPGCLHGPTFPFGSDVFLPCLHSLPLLDRSKARAMRWKMMQRKDPSERRLREDRWRAWIQGGFEAAVPEGVGSVSMLDSWACELPPSELQDLRQFPNDWWKFNGSCVAPNHFTTRSYPLRRAHHE